VERVHLSALKRFLGVSPKSPRHVVYGETGRHPLQVNTFVKCIKFWLRIVHMDTNRYPRKAYNMLLSLQEQNYVTWACGVRNVLYKFGFGVVWETQGVGDIATFVSEFKQRLVDCFKQDWLSAFGNHDFYNVYNSYKQSLEQSVYLSYIKAFTVRRDLARLRIGMSSLNCSFLQFNNHTNTQTLTCPFCDDVQETEVHFLLQCPKYNDLRAELIPSKYHSHP